MKKRSIRGNYSNSQESDAYHHRINTKMKMQRFIDRDGVCCFGKHRGTPLSLLPEDYVQWACNTIAGFEDEYNARRARKTKKRKP